MLLSLMVAAVEDLPLKSRFITIEDKTHMLLNPEFVAEGAVDAKWSPDGTQLVVICEDPKRQPTEFTKIERQTKLVFWSISARRALGTFTLPVNRKMAELMWEGPSGSLILGTLVEMGPHMSISRVLVNGNTTPLAPVVGAFRTSDKRKGVLVTVQEGGNQSAYFIPGGQTDAVKLSPPLGSVFRGLRGGDDFTVAVGAGRNVKAMNYDPSTGNFTDAPEPKPTRQVYTLKGDGISRNPTSRQQHNLSSLWLVNDSESKYPFALLSTIGTKGDFSGASFAAWYIESGNLFIRKSKVVTKQEIDDALECDEMQRLMSETKQVGTALHIYAADNDDVFPEPDKMRNAIMPYAKSEQLLAGFVPTYKGALKLFEIAEPEKLVIGYKLGDYGRAVVYADTHTVWESNRQGERKGCEP